MADISQIKIGTTIYNICDTSVRNSLSTINNNIAITHFLKVNLTENSKSSMASKSTLYTGIATWNLPSYPDGGLVYIAGDVQFEATPYASGGYGGSGLLCENTISGRETSSSDGVVGNKTSITTYKNGAQFLQIASSPISISELTNGFQNVVSGFHSNQNNNARECSKLRGYISILYGQSSTNTKTFTNSNLTISYG